MPTLEEQIAALNESLNAQQAPVLPTLPRGTPDDGTRPGPDPREVVVADHLEPPPDDAEGDEREEAEPDGDDEGDVGAARRRRHQSASVPSPRR